jgi:hypothetical protein
MVSKGKCCILDSHQWLLNNRNQLAIHYITNILSLGLLRDVVAFGISMGPSSCASFRDPDKLQSRAVHTWASVSSLLYSIPCIVKDRFDAIVTLTTVFCAGHVR